jgi:zinicin-like metallopeptidase
VKLPDFEALVRKQAADIPPEFFDGIAEVVVSPRTVPHPERSDIWTLGECIPLPSEDGYPPYIQSRVVLYFGSFQALAHGNTEFDWAAEAWETLTHEVRHHVEWRARAPGLEAFDRAAEANFARQDGQAFDPLFYRDGVRLPDGSFQVDDDLFVERVVASAPAALKLRWRGEDLEVRIPPEATLPAFLILRGAPQPPPGDLVLVLHKRSGWLELFRRPAVFYAEVEAKRVSV